MKKLTSLLMTAFLSIMLVSCTGGPSVSDSVKSTVVGKMLNGGKYKLPATASAKDVEQYKALESYVSVKVDKIEELPDGKVKFTGAVWTPDTAKVQALFMSMMMSGNKDVSRAIASTNSAFDQKKNHKASPKSDKVEVVYYTKDGKDWVESVKVIK